MLFILSRDRKQPNVYQFEISKTYYGISMYIHLSPVHLYLLPIHLSIHICIHTVESQSPILTDWLICSRH